MTDRLFTWLWRHATKWRILIGVLLIVLTNTVLFPYFPALFGAHIMPDQVLDIQWDYTPERVRQIFEEIGPAGRQATVWTTLVVDMPYLILYGLLYAAMITFLLAPYPIKAWRRLIYLPFGIALFDFLENLGILAMVGRYPASFSFLARLTTFVTKVKWSLVLLTAVTLLVLAAIRVLRPPRRR